MRALKLGMISTAKTSRGRERPRVLRAPQLNSRGFRRKAVAWTVLLSALLLVFPGLLRAEDEDDLVQRGDERKKLAEMFQIGGYVEGYYQWNFNKPSNHITNFRPFDNRHNTFTLTTIALDTQWDVQNVIGRVTLQVGNAPTDYYSSEPSWPGSAGANPTNGALWKYIQQAYTGYRLETSATDLTLRLGVFLSPVGPESLLANQNWMLSRSHLFYGFPYYHTGVTLTADPIGSWVLMAGLYNGWNSVVDGNNEKSFTLHALYQPYEKLRVNLLYFGGVERLEGSPEGRPFRNMFNAYVIWEGTRRLSVMSQINGGFEITRFGPDAWIASELTLRFRLSESFYAAVRNDIFYEHVPSNEKGRATPIFFPARWTSSPTATLQYSPASRLFFRLEYRHDNAASNQYFRGHVGDPAVTNARKQNTITIGATAWF